MKVAYLTYGIGRKSLGIGKYSWYLVNELRKLSIDVDVYTTNFHLKGLGPPVFYIKNIFVNSKNYDLIHSNEGSGVFIPHPCMVETYHHNYKQVFDTNSLIFHQLENIQCHKVPRIIVPSFKTRESLLQHGFQANKISVIHHGVDHELFRPDKVQRNFLRKKYGLTESFVVITVGRLVSHKRHKDIVEALSKIPNSALILVGEGVESNRIEIQAKENNLRLLHFKNISDEFLGNLYNTADVYAHASILEGFGLTILEAMACSLPVVCYDVADFRKIAYGAGVLLKPRDLEGMTHALLSIKERKDERQAYSQVALEKSKAFTWKKAAEEHLKVYKEVLLAQASNDLTKFNK